LDSQLKGKRALVSGASRGIGRAIAEKFLEEGASVAICARGQESLDETVEALSKYGNIIGMACDVADFDAVTAWVNDAAGKLGGIDAIVSNVSASAQMGPGPDGWRANFEADLLSAVAMVEAATPFLEQSDVASIVQIATITAVEHHNMPISASYGALKAATINHMAQVAQRLGEKGIRANTVSPGPILIEGGAWDNIKQNMTPLYERDRDQHPSKRLGTDKEVANVAVFLSSPLASWITGANVPVDGGFTKGVHF
jgi:3-oxoacyl-[acyl-carrier protein] reductase